MPPKSKNKKGKPPAELPDDCADHWLDIDLAFEDKVKSSAKPFKRSSVPSVTLEVVSNGTHPMGRPEFMLPTSASAILNNVVCREILDPSGELEPVSPTVTNLENTVRALSLGHDITPYKENIQRVASSQVEKSDVVRAYMNQIDRETIADLTVMRASSLRVIKSASRRNDLTVGEALVVWKMCNEQIPEIQKNLTEEQNKSVDTVTVIEKIDLNKQQIERSVQQRWEGTTPQGRELIRKKLWDLSRNLSPAPTT